MKRHHLCSLLALTVSFAVLPSCLPEDAEPVAEDVALAPGEAVQKGLNRDPACDGQPAGTPCADDGNECTWNVCDGLGSCNVPHLNASCDDKDNNQCTAGQCDAQAVCQPRNVEDGSSCDDQDGNDCTDGECQAGVCQIANSPRNKACGPLNKICVQDLCDGNGTCGINKPKDTDCRTEATDPCDDAKCDGLGVCADSSKKKGEVCVPADKKICHAYSCQQDGDDLACTGTCAVGQSCTTSAGSGICREPKPGQCGCYGPDGLLGCLGAETEPLCFALDECTGTLACGAGSTCLMDGSAQAPLPLSFGCEPCPAGQCPAESYASLLLVDAMEDYDSVEACELASTQGAPTLLATLRERLVEEARSWCGSDSVQVMALSDESFSWQCGYEGVLPTALYGTGAGFALCLD